LILCGLVACKSISQTDTINKVILSENLAREVVKDLTEGDACKQISLLKDKKIENFKDIIVAKDSIITSQGDYIVLQSKLLDKPNKIKFHAFTGLHNKEFRLNYLNLYVRGLVSLYKFNLGFQYSIILKNSYAYNAFLEYKLF